MSYSISYPPVAMCCFEVTYVGHFCDILAIFSNSVCIFFCSPCFSFSFSFACRNYFLCPSMPHICVCVFSQNASRSFNAKFEKAEFSSAIFSENLTPTAQITAEFFVLGIINDRSTLCMTQKRK